MQLVRAFVAALVVLASPALASAEPQFPRLTGRVVDEADLLSPETRARLDEKLAAFERQSGHQVVVATVPSLQGYAIEEYGYQLGRAWGIGRAEKNDGVLLLVSSGDRKVRIEVGYGLEGELTDALSSNIIQGVILPRFRAGRFDAGIEEGADAIVAVLGGTYQPKPVARPSSGGDGFTSSILPLLFLLFFLFLITRGGRRRGGVLLFPGGFGGGGGYGGGGSGGGGFGGGGGSFGGGGSSGGW